MDDRSSSAKPVRLVTAGDSYVIGAHRFVDRDLAQMALDRGVGAAWLEAFARHGADAPTKVQGDFAVAMRGADGVVHMAVDRFSIRTLCYRFDGHAFAVHERADVVAGSSSAFDNQAIFDYLYFHVIPAPRTVFANVQRLPAGHSATGSVDGLHVAPWWTPVFIESHGEPYDNLKGEFRRLLRDAVMRHAEGKSVGCFLSGGTDSSTLAGMLGEVTGEPARTFSIGFDADGYDEMEYARIAARHFDTDHHEYYVTADDLVASIPAVAAFYDQPFGNSSVVPSYFCAKLARDAGVARVLGGDGGDELFGGNSRYAKQRIFDAYAHVPAVFRRLLLEPMLLARPGLTAKVPLVRKAASYVEQARVPMPDRVQMYNLLCRLGLAEVLTSEFLELVDPDSPLRQQRQVYRSANAESLVNRMLAFDWRFTLADNDLRKVVGATSLAGIRVGFPLLDDGLTDFSLKLEPSLKLKGLQLRWFFKEALRGFLPDATIVKKKHGFGLPFGVWVNRHAALQSLAFESLRRLAARGIVRRQFLERLVREYLPQHPGYYGEMVWVLMMLEQWLGRAAPQES